MRRATFAAACCLGLLALAPSPARCSSFLNRKLSDWLADLNRGDRPAVRRSAAFALGRMGLDGSLALPPLAKAAAGDRDPAVRDMAAAAVGEIALEMGADFAALSWPEVGRSLEAALGDGDARVRRSAAYAMGAFGKSADGSAAALRKALRDRNGSVRQNAAWALGRLGSADNTTIADLCDLLGDPEALVRRDAAGALQNIGLQSRGSTRAAGKPLLDLVKSEKDEVVRKAALGALASLSGPEHRGQAPDLYPLLQSGDEETSRGAAYVLGNMGGEPARRALPVLRQALASPDTTVQSLAAAALANAGKDAAGAVEDLGKVLLASKEPTVRRNCCVALAHLGSDARPAVPALVAALKPGDNTDPAHEEVRELAAEALAQMGYPSNKVAIPAVGATIVRDKNQTVRQRCVWALFKVNDLGSYDLVKPLTAVLDETDDESLMVRYDTARVLARRLREKAPDKAVETLLHMLANKSLRVFRKTDASIKGTKDERGGGDTGVAPDLGGDARYMAAEALGWMGDKSRKNDVVMAALREAVKDPERRLKEAAAKSLDELK